MKKSQGGRGETLQCEGGYFSELTITSRDFLDDTSMISCCVVDWEQSHTSCRTMNFCVFLAQLMSGGRGRTEAPLVPCPVSLLALGLFLEFQQKFLLLVHIWLHISHQGAFGLSHPTCGDHPLKYDLHLTSFLQVFLSFPCSLSYHLIHVNLS